MPALVEGQERRLQAWDFVHLSREHEHMFVGAGEGPCVILMVGTRKDPEQLLYPVEEVAQRHGAGVDTETPSAEGGVRQVLAVPARAARGSRPALAVTRERAARRQGGALCGAWDQAASSCSAASGSGSASCSTTTAGFDSSITAASTAPAPASAART